MGHLDPYGPEVGAGYALDRLLLWTMTRIFISYAHKDGAEVALRLQHDLSDFDVWLDRTRLAGGVSWTDEIETAVDEADVVLALLTPAYAESRVCRAESLRALDHGRLVIPLMVVPGSNVPLHLQILQYRRYPEDVSLLRGDITGRRGIVAATPRHTYVTAPPMPAHIVQRPLEIAALRNALLADSAETCISLTAVEGMGGIGKTVLVQLLCQNEAVQQAFPDGIAWITLGKHAAADPTDYFREIAKVLQDDPAKYNNALACQHQYRTALREKCALVILDDVWSHDALTPFLAESRRSRVLFTTRDASIAAAVGAREYKADLLSQVQSRELLGSWSRVDALPPETDELVHECGRLALALSTIGAMLRGKPPAMWSHLLNLMKTAGIDKILNATRLSVDALDKKTRGRYLALGILLDDMPAHPVIQQLLWRAKSGDALVTAERLIDLSLAQRDGDSLRLHDLQLDYVRRESPWSEGLSTIHEAIRLSYHIIEKDPHQLASQLVGRLLGLQSRPVIGAFVRRLIAATPFAWLRPRTPSLTPPGTPLLLTLLGHERDVTAVAITEDGRQALSGSLDQRVKLWDLDAGREICTLAGHTAGIYAIAWSEDGRCAVSGDYDGNLKVWDMATRRELHTLRGKAGSIHSVALSADGRLAVAASGWTLEVWDLETGRKLRALAGHKGSVSEVALSRDGRLAVSVSLDGLKVWDVENGNELRTMHDRLEAYYGIALSRDGRRAACASVSRLMIWDVVNGILLRTLEERFSFDASAVALSADGSLAVAAGDRYRLNVWNVEDGRLLTILPGHSSFVKGIAISLDGRRVVSASEDRTLKVWDIDPSATLPAPPPRGAEMLAMSADGTRAVSAAWPHLILWDARTGRELRRIREVHTVEEVALSAEGGKICFASRNHMIVVRDSKTGRKLSSLSVCAGNHHAVAFSSEGGSAAVVCAFWDGMTTLTVIDLEKCRTSLLLKGNDLRLVVAISGNGQRVMCASRDHAIRVLDIERSRTLHSLTGHEREVYALSLSWDGRRALSASWDNTIRLWDVESGQEVRILRREAAGVAPARLAMSRDGKRGISVSNETVTVWALETGDVIARFTSDGTILCCTVGGDRICVGDVLDHVHFLDLLG
jgi:WD40 repeat protein